MQGVIAMGEYELRAIRKRIRQLQYDNLVKVQKIYQRPGMRGKVFLGSADPQEAVEQLKTIQKHYG